MATRFLLVRLDGLGDTVLTTPLLRAIRAHWDDAHVTVITSPAGHACLEGHPGVDASIVFSATSSTLAQKLALGRRLRSTGFDIAISVTEKAWGYLWVRMSGAPRRVGFWDGARKPVKSLLFRPTLTDRVDAAGQLPEAERHMKLLEPLGVREAAGPLWLAGPKGAGTARVALHLSAKWLTDGWDESWLMRLIERLADTHPLLVTAGALEGAWARALCARIDAREGRIRSRVDVSYAAWTEALSTCCHLISTDTGAVHVAAGLGLPVVDVFPREDAASCVARWRPWMVPHRIVLRGQATDGEYADRVMQEIVDASRSLEQR